MLGQVSCAKSVVRNRGGGQNKGRNYYRETVKRVPPANGDRIVRKDASACALEAVETRGDISWILDGNMCNAM